MESRAHPPYRSHSQTAALLPLGSQDKVKAERGLAHRCPSWIFDPEAFDPKEQRQWRIYLAGGGNIHYPVTAGTMTNTRCGWMLASVASRRLLLWPGLGCGAGGSASLGSCLRSRPSSKLGHLLFCRTGKLLKSLPKIYFTTLAKPGWFLRFANKSLTKILTSLGLFPHLHKL